MELFNKLLGSSKVVDAAIATGDALFHTSEEKAEWKLRLLKMYEPFKLIQRYLALIISIPYMSAWTITFIASLFVDNIDAQLDMLTNTKAAWAFVAVQTLYFTGGVLEGSFRAKQK